MRLPAIGLSFFALMGIASLASAESSYWSRAAESFDHAQHLKLADLPRLGLTSSSDSIAMKVNCVDFSSPPRVSWISFSFEPDVMFGDRYFAEPEREKIPLSDESGDVAGELGNIGIKVRAYKAQGRSYLISYSWDKSDPPGSHLICWAREPLLAAPIPTNPPLMPPSVD